MTTVVDASFLSPNEGKKCDVFADSITIKVPSEMTNGTYSISEDVTPPGQGAPPDWFHLARELFLTFFLIVTGVVIFVGSIHRLIDKSFELLIGSPHCLL
jgi:hypothetical protein